MNKHMREPANGFVSSHANGKWGSQAIYVILNVGLTSVFQNLVKKFPLALWEREQLCEQSELTTAGEGLIRCEEAKRQRCKASIVKTYNPSPQWGEGATLPRKDKFSSRFTLHSSPRRKAAFTLAEMMVVMLILSIIMAAMAPVMTTRNKLDQSSPWVWATNGSDAYYGVGDSQVAMIGQQEAEDTDTNARLVINAGDGKDHILFKTDNSSLGQLRFSNNGLLLGSLSSGNLVENSVAIGRNTQVAQDNSTAVGVNASATNSNATAIGHSASASGTYAIAIGGEAPPAHAAQSNSDGSIAIGAATVASQAGSIAMGPITESTGLHSIAIGTNNKVSGPDSVVLGSSINTSSSNSISIGAAANAVGESSIAIGSGTSAEIHSVSIGDNITSIGSYAVSLGDSANADGINAVALGSETISTGSSSVSLGYKAHATAADTTSIGNQTAASKVYATALGDSAEASAINSTALGYDSAASGNYSIALGSQAKATNYYGIAIGPEAQSTGSYYATAIGYGAKALGSHNVAIGYNACRYVKGSNKVCIGANSGPSSGSSWASASDSTERIFIGSRSNFNNGPAVLEVHNGTTSNSDGTALHGQKISSSVVINGLLIVKGGIISAAAENDDKHIRTGGVYWFANRDQDSQAAVIGVGSGLDNFQNNGNFKSPNDWSYNFSVSDRRLKYVGKENTSGLDKIKQLKVFNYTFKKDEKKTPHVGVIAQDLQKVFPDAVTKAKDGFLRIRFEDMFYAMINAIKELDAKYQAQEKRINELEARIEKLEAQIK